MKLGRIVRKFRTKKDTPAVIRYPVWEDLDDLTAFANSLSREDTYVMLSGEHITRDREISYLSDTIAAMIRGERIHLVVTVNGAFAANSGITIQKRRKRHVGELTISVAAAFRDDGVGFELLTALIAEARKHRLKLITLTCMEGNDRALHLYEKAGFKRAGIIPKALRFRGRYVGEVMLYRAL